MQEKKIIEKLLKEHFFSPLMSRGWKKYKTSSLARLADDIDICQFIYLQKSANGDKFSVTLYFKSLGRLLDQSIMPGCRLGFLVSGIDKWYAYDEHSIDECLSDFLRFGETFFVDYSSKTAIIESFTRKKDERVLPHSSRNYMEMYSYLVADGNLDLARQFLEKVERLIDSSEFRYDDEIAELKEWKAAMQANAAEELLHDSRKKNLEKLGFGERIRI